LALIAATFAVEASGQTTRTPSKGPRAVAILEFDDKNRVHLIPITIMLDGEFYDASAYKASPVPMALETETVYEGLKTGVSQGFFTINRSHEVLGIWVGEGKWEPAGLKKAEKKKAPLEPVEEVEGPPVLKRGAADKSADKPKTGENTPPVKLPGPAPTEPSPDSSISVGGMPKPKVTEAPSEPDERPVLRRGAPENPIETPEVSDSRGTSAWKVVTTIAAVSDAHDKTPHSYHYLLPPQAEADDRDKVLALAAKEFKTRTGASTVTPLKVPTRSSKSATTAAQPNFENVNFETFDPSTNNEPVFVLSADVKEAKSKANNGLEIQHHVVLVVRQDIYNELHVIFSQISDPQHMDSQPRYDLIDLVDADGDGYGELLFRRTYDSGRAYSVYRVIGNQLWPLFEGKQ